MRKSHSHAHACADKQEVNGSIQPSMTYGNDGAANCHNFCDYINYLSENSQSIGGFSYRSDFMHYDKVDNQPKLTCTSDTMNSIY